MELANRSEVVDQFMQRLDHPLKAEIEAVRAIILGADAGITEQIKWNAPSFCYQGDDRVTFRLHPSNQFFQLIFHRGAKVKEPREIAIQDDAGLLEWVASDRATLSLRSMDEVQTHADALKSLVSQWVKATA